MIEKLWKYRGMKKLGIMAVSMLLIEDQNGIWTEQTTVDIFSQSYQGSEEAGTAEQFTVENDGSDQRKLIAPGTEKSYTFQITNTGEAAVKYIVSFQEDSTDENLPLQVRGKCGDTYFLGGEQAWEPIEQLNYKTHEGVLKKDGSVNYTLEWQWLFEKNDVQDTELGNQAVEKIQEQTIQIHVRGEEAETKKEKSPQNTHGEENHEKDNLNVGIKTGDESKLLLWMLACLMAAMALAVLLWMRWGQSERIRGIVRKVGSMTLLLLMLAVIGCNLYLLVERIVYKENYPSIFGYSTAVVVSGSMEDEIHIDDLVVIHRDEQYNLGDIITYDSGKSLVTHRIVGKTAEGFETKGDANNIKDADPVKEEQILGRVVKVIPGVGKVLYFLGSPIRLLESMGRYSSGIHFSDHAGIDL